MSDGPTRYSVCEAIVLLVVLAAIGFVYVGFFFPDPLALHTMGRLTIVALLWGTRIGIPLVAIGGLALYHGVKTGRVEKASVGLLVGALVVGGLLLYPLANTLYLRAANAPSRTRLFHPFLQIKPGAMAVRGPDRVAVVCLGGSTTAYKDSHDVGWPARVEQRLRTHFKNERIDVHNMGTPWYTTLHSLVNYQTNVRPARPRVILVMHAINDLLVNADFCRFSSGEFRDDYGHFLGSTAGLLTRKGMVANLFDKLGMFWYHTPREVLEPTTFAGLAPFKRNLNAIVDLAEADGTRVVLLTQPNLYKDTMSDAERECLYMLNVEAVGRGKRWGLNAAREGMRQYVAATRAVAAERKVTLVDLEAHVPKTTEYFSDDVHYRDPAFDLIADAIGRKLVEADLLAGSQATRKLTAEPAAKRKQP